MPMIELLANIIDAVLLVKIQSMAANLFTYERKWRTNMRDSPTKPMRADNVEELDVLITAPKRRRYEQNV